MAIQKNRNITYLGLLITAAIFLGHYFLPPKQLVLHPKSANLPNLYGFIDAEKGQSSFWIDQGGNKWGCSYKPSHSYGCGWSIFLNSNEQNGLNMQAYDAVELTMAYRGPATRIRLYMRNFNEAYASPDDIGSAKFMSASFPVVETEGPVLVRLSEFTVASWWFRERNVRRRWSSPEFDNVINLGVDLIEKGDHEMRVERIALVGSWIRTETLLIGIFSFWMSVFLCEGMIRFYQLYRKSHQDRVLIHALEIKQRSLEEEKKNLAELADTDPLTAVNNRAGLQVHVDKLFADGTSASGLGIMLLDIDHFKKLNDSYGHDMGDKVLKAFAAVMSANLRDDDVFARWGGEEFIVLCHKAPLDKLRLLAEKLRDVTGNCIFGGDANIRVSVSIGIAVVRSGEAFEQAFKRADIALLQAKKSGRNRVEPEGAV